MNFGPQTAQNRIGGFTYPHYFVLSQSIAHPLCGINVAPTAALDETHWVHLQLRFEAPKDVKLEMLSRRAALSGNTSL